MVNDNLDSGLPPTDGPSVTPVAVPTVAVPTMLVFDGVGSLAESLLGTFAAPEGQEVPLPPLAPAPPEAVTDDERTRYGLLLDRAAERGLLDPAEYEIRLRELAEATSTARMLEIVTELPAFTVPPPTTSRSPRPVRSTNRAGVGVGAGGQRPRTTLWVVLAVVIVVAVVSVIILALSVERLSRTHQSSQPRPVATRPFSAPRL